MLGWVLFLGAAVIVSMGLGGSTSLSAQPVTREQLPPEAAREFERGLLAVEQGQWDQATRLFIAALRKAGDDASPPSLLFNIGLAQARAGRELSAMAWFIDYLSASPQASNSGQVRREIQRMQITVRRKAAQVVNEAWAVALSSGMCANSMDGDLDTISTAQAMLGDLEDAVRRLTITAQKTCHLPPRPEYLAHLTEQTRLAYGYGLARAGHPREAGDFLKGAGVRDDPTGGRYKPNDVWQRIAMAWLDAGDIGEATRIANSKEIGRYRGVVEQAISEVRTGPASYATYHKASNTTNQTRPIGRRLFLDFGAYVLDLHPEPREVMKPIGFEVEPIDARVKELALDPGKAAVRLGELAWKIADQLRFLEGVEKGLSTSSKEVR